MAASTSVQDYGPILLYVTIGFTIPAGLVFAWRMVTRFSRNSPTLGFGIDDLMLTCAMVSLYRFLI